MKYILMCPFFPIYGLSFIKWWNEVNWIWRKKKSSIYSVLAKIFSTINNYLIINFQDLNLK